MVMAFFFAMVLTSCGTGAEGISQKSIVRIESFDGQQVLRGHGFFVDDQRAFHRFKDEYNP